jgi:hypothetical protein
MTAYSTVEWQFLHRRRRSRLGGAAMMSGMAAAMVNVGRELNGLGVGGWKAQYV